MKINEQKMNINNETIYVEGSGAAEGRTVDTKRKYDVLIVVSINIINIINIMFISYLFFILFILLYTIFTYTTNKYQYIYININNY